MLVIHYLSLRYGYILNSAGTGLLSMMAARAMGLSDSNGSSSSNGIVTACESYLPMVKLMRKVLRANGMNGKIHVINKRSDELEVGLDIPSRADILVSTNSTIYFLNLEGDNLVDEWILYPVE